MKILTYHHSINLNNIFSILSWNEYHHIENTLINNEEEVLNLYFKIETNRFYNINSEIRTALSNLIDNIGIENVKIILCSFINKKLGPKILY